MAKRCCKLLLFFTLLSSITATLVSSFEFEAGDETGWVVPSSNNTQFYNQWASKNQFQTGDTVNFKFKEDSVMVVSEEDYKDCNSLHPIFFSNKGNTVFELGHSWAFYFIRDVSGHCKRGQKMIVKVLGLSGSTPSGNQTRTPSNGSGKFAPTTVNNHHSTFFRPSNRCRWYRG